MSNFISEWGSTLTTGLGATLAMTAITLIVTIIIGIPLGILLVETNVNGMYPNRPLHAIFETIVNILRSLPFIILLFLILPVTQIVAGTTIGIRGVILPLVIYCAPYLARLVESSLLDVDPGIIEAYQSMGIKNSKIVFFILLREARSGITRGLTISIIGLIGATAMAGLVGAGGLGDIAYQYGFQRYQPDVMYASILILIALVQIVQSLGNWIAKKLSK
ncbi:methionine ABC transporter permease [Lentilactobacillus farraginis]|uniref:Methionine ABC superfamily ATP binding cassette transporter, membrane protein n=2 Tax=Lentilactobacillus farraginis DSM 18382 = JCM 14108 TaxID=1423743 RepID=A0A0R1VGL7_9LACO|nr:methionine ABC transporter permease [Lentilactobacillus farraginis]KRM03291.1 methionine ABC superfamily ATP binding cassette transporter, membrane protein [Lentilactobacillus farraginis DSM 18382 = JCM 14108]